MSVCLVLMTITGAILFSPPLTVFQQPTREIGIQAAKALIQKINHKRTQRISLEGELIIRGSCSEKCLALYKNTVAPELNPTAADSR
jgi:hypothetical protein